MVHDAHIDPSSGAAQVPLSFHSSNIYLASLRFVPSVVCILNNAQQLPRSDVVVP